MEKGILKRLAQLSFSIIPINNDKTPKGSWKKNQTNHLTPDEIDKIESDSCIFANQINSYYSSRYIFFFPACA